MEECEGHRSRRRLVLLTGRSGCSARVPPSGESIGFPDYDKEELFRYQKVINEPEFLPLHFVRIALITLGPRVCGLPLEGSGFELSVPGEKGLRF